MTRIIAGSAGGQRLDTPASGTRPTSDRVREGIFSRLAHEDALVDARVLDLYAGSGALGLEALSRGARGAVFVESHREAAQICRQNLHRLGWADRGHVISSTVRSYLTAGPPAQPFHTILADPPYGLHDADSIHAMLAVLLEPGWLGPDALILWEQSGQSPPPAWPAPLTDLGWRRYGQTTVHLAELRS